MRIQVVTCNTVRENGKYKDSYHEIHEIDNLKNVDHIIATVKSIVTNNELFKDANVTLDSVIVSGSDYSVINKVIDFFTRQQSKVSIMGAETAMMAL